MRTTHWKENEKRQICEDIISVLKRRRDQQMVPISYALLFERVGSPGFTKMSKALASCPEAAQTLYKGRRCFVYMEKS